MHDEGVNGADFVPGGLNHHHEVWQRVVFRGHPQAAQLLSYPTNGVSVFEFLTEENRGVSREFRYRREAFPGTSVPNRIPQAHAGFVRSKVAALVKRGCLARMADVKGPTGPARPRLVLPLSIEPSKPRLVIDARALNECCRHVPFKMDTVAKVANVAEEGIYMGSLDDRSGVHNLSLQRESWPLFGVSYDNTDYVALPSRSGGARPRFATTHLAKHRWRTCDHAAFLSSPTSTTRGMGTSLPHSGALTMCNGCPLHSRFTRVCWSRTSAATSCRTPSAP